MLKLSLRKSGTSVSKRLRDFFGGSVLDLPIAARGFSAIDLPNLHLALETVTHENSGTFELVGYIKSMAAFANSLRELMVEGGYDEATVGPIQYREVEIGEERSLSCVEDGLFLITIRQGKLAALIRQDQMKHSLQLEVVAATKELGTDFIAMIQDSMARNNVYRGKVLSLESRDVGRPGCDNLAIRFHTLPHVRREQIILPEEILSILERNTIGFFQHGSKLVQSGRSAKRGLLLFGKPGTGKTFTARWLAQSTPGLTVLLLSGEQLWLVRECCQIARMLAPSLVIMEDVDLIAAARDESRHPMYQVTLHQLLNEMDGIDAPAPILFLLTTNRPEAIEPAIASRPGRIDQAIEYPLPDADCRRRLIELYGVGLDMDLKDIGSIVSRTEGASPAFIQEMLRKAALLAAEEQAKADGPLRVTDRHCHAAIQELLFSGGNLTRRLLGFSVDTPNARESM